MISVPNPNLIELVLLFLLGGGFGLPSGVPPMPEDPMMAKVAPAECLFYTTWAATATPDATGGNHTEKLMAEPEIDHFLVQGQRAFMNAVLGPRAASKQVRQAVEDVSRLLDVLHGKSGAFFLADLDLNEDKSLAATGGGVVRVDDDSPHVKQVLMRLQSRAAAKNVSTVLVAGKNFSRVRLDAKAPPIVWGLDGNYLVVGIGDGSAEKILQRMQGKPPDWLKSLRARLSVPRIRALTYLNVHGFAQTAFENLNLPPHTQPIFTALGLDSLKIFVSVSGLDDTGCVRRSLLTVDGPGRGLLSWIDSAPLEANDLKRLGRDTPIAIAFRLDPSTLVDGIVDLAGQIDPDAPQMLAEFLAEFEPQIGINVREDLLKSLGGTWRIFAQPGANGMFTGWTLAIQVLDRERLDQVQHHLVAFVDNLLSQAGPGAPSLRSTANGDFTVYTLDLNVPGIPVSPSWCVTDHDFIITATQQTLTTLLSRGDGDPSLADLPDVKALLTEGPRTLALAYIDTQNVVRTLLPVVKRFLEGKNLELDRLTMTAETSGLPPAEVVVSHLQRMRAALKRTPDGIEFVSYQSLPGPNLPAALPVAVATLLLPAIQSAHEAALRMRSIWNLNQIALGLHTFHDAFGAFPAGYSANQDGKPLLSWRVLILPFIGQAALYNQFHLDEPWDSPHNKKLIPQMPDVYRSPNSTAKPGMTVYLGVAGSDGIFVRPKPGGVRGSRIREIVDGTANTIMLLEVPDEATVIWTRPGDFAPDEKDPKQGVFGMRPGGVLACFADGSVRFIADTIDVKTLSRLFTKSDRKPIQNIPVGPIP